MSDYPFTMDALAAAAGLPAARSSWRDRILNDGTDRESWLADRHPVIGASDAAKLSKPESVDKYLAAKLASNSFHGNDYTESGRRWEPMMLAWAGITPNVALIHSPAEIGFAATPDGADETRGAECKAKHGRIVDGPSVGEWRQLACVRCGSWTNLSSAAWLDRQMGPSRVTCS